MLVDGSAVSLINYSNHAVNQKGNNVNGNNGALFAYMNAGLSIPSDGTTIAYMNANNSGSSSGSCGSSCGSTVCIA